ncbi:MAG TPA: hypothetical protein VFC63_28490 [Blastocatellia bacterium]|nr:hypothetical protein [Blastocatellia bacterium]
MNQQDKSALLKKASAAYYTLKSQGVSGFKCVASSDWNKYIEDNLKQNPLPDAAVAKLKTVRMEVSVSDTGAPTVTAVTPDGSEIDDSISQVTDAASQFINSFYQAWWPFVFNNPFTDFDPNYDLQNNGSGYQIHQKQGASDVTIVMGKDYALSEMDVVLPNNSTIFRPKYTSTNKGLLLSELETDTKASQQQVNITVSYQDVEGLKLPSKMSYKMNVPNGSAAIEVTFTKYQLIKS